MKKIIYLALILLAAVACNKDEIDPTKPDSELSFNGKTYLLKSASVNKDIWQDQYQIRTTYHFTFTDIEMPDSYWEEPVVSELGGASVLNFSFDKKYDDFDYNNKDTLAVEYNDSIYFAYFGVDFNLADKKFKSETRFTNGNFYLEKQLDKILVKFNCTNTSGQTLTGQYYGKIYLYETLDF
jgi:hypothetical protein